MPKHNKLNTALLLIIATSSGQSRQVLYEEDFSDGDIPINWSTTDLTANNALWTHCDDPSAGQNGGSTGGCPPLWDDALNLQGPFAATTASNGFITLDSDRYGNISHVSTITTPAFDFSGQNSVYVEFEGFIGAYTIVPLDNAVLEVSDDDFATVTTYNPYPNLILGSPNPPLRRWSFNPTKSSFDVSAAAAGKGSVKMRFLWRGNFEFLWSIDDFVIADKPDLILTNGFESIP